MLIGDERTSLNSCENDEMESPLLLSVKYKLAEVTEELLKQERIDVNF